MRNYILGLLSGIAGAWLWSATTGWMVWILFLASIVLIALGLDVFFGSKQENQPKAARMGLVLFTIPGAVMQVLVWILAV